MNLVRPITILVTGCGGDLGASIARICKDSGIFERIIGANNHDRHFSKYLYDKYYVVGDFGTQK